MVGFFPKRHTPSPEQASHLFLEGQVKTMELSLMKLEEQNLQLERLVEGYRGDARKNMGELQRVAQTICDNEYAKEQLGGKNRILALSAFELANFIIDNWKKQQQEAITLVTNLQKELKKRDGAVKDLEDQLSRVLLKQQEDAYEHHSNIPVFQTDDGRKVDPETGEILPSTPAPSPSQPSQEDDILSVVQSQTQTPPPAKPKPQPQATPSSSKVEPPKTHLVMLEKFEKELTEVQWKIVEVIGTEGLSEAKEIETRIGELISDVNNTQFTNAINSLKTSTILDMDKVNTGYRWFFAYNLSDLGLQLYQRKFKKPAILCEKHVLKKENATWDHGYAIKDTATLMEQMGLMNITYKRKDNEITLSNGKVWIPDITAYDSLAKKKLYVEVELAHHTQEEFNTKMDKARQVTKDIRFVTTGKKQMEIIIQQFSQWKLEKIKSGTPVKNFDVFITTTKKLADKDWGNHYPS
ncbi:hypothetical protein ACFYKX_10110 [Cytobacillus sp. FJAT-54145]|uniref:Uncharacterized protein n=1 Tax=Cytobacillus spartinae TaxID=3299023 RepID=A0ABW6KCJ4_9BACI